MTQDQKNRLEEMVDLTSLTEVLEALEEICYLKAEHLRTNWQDKVSAKLWEHDSQVIDRAIGKLA